jgi:uncharacterized membrane protein YidH (DUF202 family)
MESKAIHPNYDEQIKNWIDTGLDNESILLNLKKLNIEEAELAYFTTHIKKIRNKNRTRTGSILVLIGVIILGLGFISCIVLHYMDQDINFSLYGLTGIGAIALIVGLILIFN